MSHNMEEIPKRHSKDPMGMDGSAREAVEQPFVLNAPYYFPRHFGVSSKFEPTNAPLRGAKGSKNC